MPALHRGHKRWPSCLHVFLRILVILRIAFNVLISFTMKRKSKGVSFANRAVDADETKRLRMSNVDDDDDDDESSISDSDDSTASSSLVDSDSSSRIHFESAKDSTSVFKSVKETETYLDCMISRRNSDGSDCSPGSPLHHRETFYSHLLPVYLKTHLLRIHMISVPAAYLSSLIMKQGVKKYFSFENLRVFHTDNACLMFDHRFLSGPARDFVVTIVAHPVGQKSSAQLSSPDDLTCGAGTVSRSSRTGVRSFVLRPNFSLTRSVSMKHKTPLKHAFCESFPASFWWNTFDHPSVVAGDESFKSKIENALSRRPVVMDFLFSLANIDEKNNSITRIVNTAKWESGKDKDAVNRAALTINTMLCFGFRILSFGMLCEYPKDLTKRWLKAEPTTVGSSGCSKRTYAARRRKLMDTFQHVNTAMSGVKRKAVMRMVYTLDTTEDAVRFFKIMDKYGSVIKHRVVRSRCFYNTEIGEDLIGRCYVYPNHSLYMVIGSCYMTHTTCDTSKCAAASYTKAMLDVPEDRLVKDPWLDSESDDDDDRLSAASVTRTPAVKIQSGGKTKPSKVKPAKKTVSLSTTTPAVRPSKKVVAVNKEESAPASVKRPLTSPSSSVGAAAVKVTDPSVKKSKKAKVSISLSPRLFEVDKPKPRPTDG